WLHASIDTGVARPVAARTSPLVRPTRDRRPRAPARLRHHPTPGTRRAGRHRRRHALPPARSVRARRSGHPRLGGRGERTGQEGLHPDRRRRAATNGRRRTLAAVQPDHHHSHHYGGGTIMSSPINDLYDRIPHVDHDWARQAVTELAL